jgi:hypothetical protein
MTASAGGQFMLSVRTQEQELTLPHLPPLSPRIPPLSNHHLTLQQAGLTVQPLQPEFFFRLRVAEARGGDGAQEREAESVAGLNRGRCFDHSDSS